jgi:hypothetical protein
LLTIINSDIECAFSWFAKHYCLGLPYIHQEEKGHLPLINNKKEDISVKRRLKGLISSQNLTE